MHVPCPGFPTPRGPKSCSSFTIEGHCSLKVSSKGQQTFGAELLSPRNENKKSKSCCEQDNSPRNRISGATTPPCHTRSVKPTLLQRRGKIPQFWRAPHTGLSPRRVRPPPGMQPAHPSCIWGPPAHGCLPWMMQDGSGHSWLLPSMGRKGTGAGGRAGDMVVPRIPPPAPLSLLVLAL